MQSFGNTNNQSNQMLGKVYNPNEKPKDVRRNNIMASKGNLIFILNLYLISSC